MTKEILKDHIITAIRHCDRWLRRCWDRLTVAVLLVMLLCGGIWYVHRYTPAEETLLRHSLVDTAEQWLGCSEADGTHRVIVDRYNAQDPLPRDYALTYEDNWCAAFGTAAALEAGFGDIIPAECSCEQQIGLFQELGRWEENDCYLPRPGDYIYYVWDEWRQEDCTAWANHVGIVADTFGPVIKVIEGNKDDQVTYRYILLNHITIRGYGLPDYSQKY